MGRVVARAGTGLDVIHLGEFPDRPFLIAKSDQVIRQGVKANSRWEAGLASFVGAMLSPESRVVIAGGHVGLLAFELWQARPDIREIAVYEPDSVNAALLTLNVLTWGESPVHALPFALGARTELLDLARNPINTGDNRLWASIPADLDAGGGDPRHWPRQPVVSVALDEIWDADRLDLILLDAQGWEPDVLQGADELLRTRRPLVVFEWWPRALRARGFDLEALLSWFEDDLHMKLGVVPPEFSGFSNPAIHDLAGEDIRQVTELLLEDPDHAAYVELVARPSGASSGMRK
jgi:FkbM family methyltransferase